ncbi:hypothetical protein [Sphingomonas sp.]|uniref:hypothetical protein n=1 Tax=Sphingomonas sp. TaxID=28214 RepID=UPI00286BAAD9|nr:hypothetical protein [Sphingomonas sp.]
MFRPLIIAVLLVTTAPTIARPTSATSSPEVIFTLTSRSGTYDLRVANEDGTGAASLFKGNSQLNGKFGPRADRTIAFWNGGNLTLLTYDATSTGVRTTGTRVLLNSGRNFASPFDFSGRDIAWWHPETGDLHNYNLASGTDSILFNVPQSSSVSFNPDGTAIFYSEAIGSTDYVMRRIPITGGSPTDVGITGHIMLFDTGHQSDKFVVSYQVTGVGPHLDYIPAGATSGTTFGNGYGGAFRCDDRVIIFRHPTGNNSSNTLKYDVQTNTTSTFSSDNNVVFASYMPTCN